MAVKVTVPNKGYNEYYFGVHFIDGVAVFEDEDKGKKVASRLGYKVEEIAADKPVEKLVEKKPVPKGKAAKKATDKKEG